MTHTVQLCIGVWGRCIEFSFNIDRYVIYVSDSLSTRVFNHLVERAAVLEKENRLKKKIGERRGMPVDIFRG